MLTLKQCNSLFRAEQYNKALSGYLKFSSKVPELAGCVIANIELCRLKLESRKSIKSSRGPKVSIIIPAYNVEAYIDKCIGSVTSQTLNDIEIVVVNDGSTDRTSALLKVWAEQDDRIVLIDNYRASGNSGTPRNLAIARARGEYIAFVDSDDWIDPTMLETMYAKAVVSDADIVTSKGFYRELPDGETKEVQLSNFHFDGVIPEARKNLFLSPHFPIVWCRIYRAEFVRANRLTFGETKTSADLPFAFKALFCANKVTSVDGIFYHYRFDRPGSTIDRRRGRGAFELFKAYDNIVRFLDEKSTYNTYISCVVLKALGDYEYNKQFLIDQLRSDFRHAMSEFVGRHYESAVGQPEISAPWARLLESLGAHYREHKGHFSGYQTGSSGPDPSAPKVSIIVPVHNAEKYLNKCMASLLEQSLRDIEVVVVEDGSSDQSEQILRAFAQTDERIKLIICRKASGNPGMPRNIGLSVASGEYVGFVDSDDWVELNMYDALYAAALENNADIASASHFHRHQGRASTKLSINYREIGPNETDRRGVFDSEYLSNVWNRIYRRDFLERNRILFPEIYLSEDLCFSFVCHALALRTCAVDGSYYHYNYDRMGSTTSLRKGKRGFAIIESFDEIRRYFSAHGLYSVFASEIAHKKLNSLSYTFSRIDREFEDEFVERCRGPYFLHLQQVVDQSKLPHQVCGFISRLEQLQLECAD